MSDLTIVRPNQIEGKDNLLFSLGDLEVQRQLFSGTISRQEIVGAIELNLRITTLLNDIVVQSGSYFFESPLSREVYRKHSILFSEGDNLFVIRSEAEDFLNHKRIKERLCPSMKCYQSKQADQWANELQLYGRVGHLYSGDISDSIEKLWIKDLEPFGLSFPDNFGQVSLDSLIRNNIQDKKEEEKHRELLISIVEKRQGLELVRDYVAEQLSIGDFREDLRPYVYERLLDFYLKACSEMMGVGYMEPRDLTFDGILSLGKYNAQLFLSFMEILGVRKAILCMSDRQLLQLKHSEVGSFYKVRQTYFEIIHEAKTIEDGLAKLRWAYYRDKVRYTYSQYRTILKRLSQIILLSIIKEYVDSLPAAVLAMAGPEVVDIVIAKMSRIEHTPLSDFKNYVIEEYGRKMCNTLTSESNLHNYLFRRLKGDCCNYRFD